MRSKWKHPPEPKGIGLPRLNSRFPAYGVIFLASLALLGCGSSPATSNSNGNKETVTPPARTISVEDVESPLIGSDVNLGLLHESQTLHIGDNVDTVFEQDFPRPDKASNVTQMPPGLDNTFRARGWETANESFGVVLKGGRVGLAIYTVTGSDEDFLNELVARYISRFGEPGEKVGAAGVRYWFWQDRDVRLMICSGYSEDGRLSVTSALGLKSLMDFLRMDIVSAREDREEAERLLKNQQSKEKAPTPATNL